MEKPIVTAAQMKRCDSYTINHIGIPSLVLMERAALAVRDEILNALPIYLSHVVVVAGSGNNGGRRPLAEDCRCPSDDSQRWQS